MFKKANPSLIQSIIHREKSVCNSIYYQKEFSFLGIKIIRGGFYQYGSFIGNKEKVLSENRHFLIDENNIVYKKDSLEITYSNDYDVIWFDSHADVIKFLEKHSLLEICTINIY